MKTWKEIAGYLAIILVVIIAVAGIVFGVRSFTNITTPIAIYTPKPGITCAMATASDGVALSCWKD